MPLPPGAVIAGYRVVRLLGEGGMGAVYLVQHPDLPRQDVLKVMHGGMARHAALRARFEHEATLAAGLNHPNIVQVFDRGVTDDDQLWIRMQYVEGTDAAEALAAGPMQPGRVVNIVRSVGSALDYAHRAGLLHRDVKPANILLTPAGHADDAEHVMLADFGIAKAMDTDVQVHHQRAGAAHTGVELGSRAVRDGTDRLPGRRLRPRLRRLRGRQTGRLPYPHHDFLVLMAAHDREPVPDVRDLRPELADRPHRGAPHRHGEGPRSSATPTCRAFAAGDLGAALQRRDVPPAPRPPPPPSRTEDGPAHRPRERPAEADPGR